MFNEEFSSQTNSNEELLNFALKCGIINLDDVQNQMTKKHREDLLKQHPYEIWQGKDNRYRTYIDDDTKKSKRKMLVKTHEDDLLNLLVEHYKALEKNRQNADSTLKSLYPKWLEYKSLHTNAQNYIRRINNDWNKYYLNTSIIDIPLKKLNKLTLDEWAHRLIKDYHMTKKQYYNASIIMRQALEYAVDLGMIASNPLAEVSIDGKRLFRQIKKKPDYTQVFLKSEIALLLNMAWDDFYSGSRKTNRLAPLAILFQFQTGVRLGELCALRYEDIDSSGYIRIQRMYRYETHEIVDHTKTYEDRKILLTSLAQKIIESAKQFQKAHDSDYNSYIFSEDNKPLSPWSVEYLYNKYSNQLGTVRKASHKARKTYISALIDGQVNINTVREMAGHSDERTTLGNYCFDRNNDLEKRNLIENALCS